MYKYSRIPSGQLAIAIVEFPINSMVIFHSYVNVYQRVNVVFLFNGFLEKTNWCFFWGKKHGNFRPPMATLESGS